MDNILIFGGFGMLGTDLRAVLVEHEYCLWAHNDWDIINEEEVDYLAQKYKPTWIINCAAITNVDGCEGALKDIAYQVNGYALENIAKSAKKVGANVIHISTDYVFDGTKKNGYIETDVKAPQNEYGKSKALGEDLLLQYHPEGSYIIRTSWLYGKAGKNFVSTMVELASKGTPINVVNDQKGCPTFTRDLSQFIRNIIEKSPEPGIYHGVNTVAVSWYDFACEIFRLQNLQVDITPVSTKAFPRPAKRPAYSILLNTKTTPMRSWSEALKEFLIDRA